MSQRVSPERVAEIKREYAEYWEGSVSPFDGQRRWLYWRVRGKDVVDLIADLEDLRAALRAGQDAFEHANNCEDCQSDFLCDELEKLAGTAAELRRNALAATEATSDR